MIPDSLQTISEISIGLAGFSGLIVALRRNSGPLTHVQKFRLRLLFALTFGALFLSLLPELLHSFRVPDDRIWFDSSASMFCFSLWFVTWMVVAGRRISRDAPEIFNWYFFYGLASGHVIVLLLQLAVMTGFIDDRAPGAFMLGLIWFLLHAAQQFTRMLFIQPRDPDHA